MKKILAFLLVMAITGGVLWLHREPEPRVIRKPHPEQKAGIDAPDNPNARMEWEWMRLRNPWTGKIPENIRQRELAFVSHLPVRNGNVPLYRTDATGAKQVITISNWSGRGPYNVGGRTRALAVDVSNENIILAGGVSGGMWRSTDGGQSWTKVTPSNALHSVTCLVQDTRPGKTHIWYYGTGEYRGNSASGGSAPYRGDGIFKSTDGGVTWSVLPSTATNKPHKFDNFFDYVWNLAIDVSNPNQDEIYAATYGGIFRSVDGGQSWSNVLVTNYPNYSSFTDVAITSTGVVYATLSSDGDKAGIWRSTDGINWVNITPSGFPSDYRRIVIGIAPSNENVVYFLGETPGAGLNNHSLWKYTYVSGDGSGNGGNWEDRSANLPLNNSAPVETFDSQSSYDLLIRVKPDDENVVIIGGTNLYLSTDGFATQGNYRWIGGYNATTKNYSWYPNHHPDQHALVFYPSNPNKVVSGHDGGLSLTTNIMANPVTWSTLNKGYYTTQFYTVAIDTSLSGDQEIIGGMQDNGTWQVKSTSQTASWIKQLSGDGGYCYITPGKQYYYFSWQNGTVFRAQLDPAGNWTVWTEVDPSGVSNHLFINPFILDAKLSKVMYYAGYDALWRNNDLTAIPDYQQSPTSVNWTQLTNTQLPSGEIITALEVSTDHPQHRVYYGTSNGRVFRLDNAHTGNPVPAEITGASFPTGAYVSSISVNPDNGDEVMVAFSNYEVISIWHSLDGGNSWTNVSGNLEQNADGSGDGPSVRWVEIVAANNAAVYFAGTSAGLFSTTQLNGSNTQWSQEGPSTIGNVVVDMIASRPKDGLVVVGTHGNGVFSAQVSSPLVVEAPSQSVKAFRLYPNYPNPFNPATTIAYDIARTVPVELTIYDLQGREVVTLVRGVHQPGHYTVQWNGQDRFGRPVAGGQYFYRLKAGAFSRVRSMLFLK